MLITLHEEDNFSNSLTHSLRRIRNKNGTNSFTGLRSEIGDSLVYNALKYLIPRNVKIVNVLLGDSRIAKADQPIPNFSSVRYTRQ